MNRPVDKNVTREMVEQMSRTVVRRRALVAGVVAAALAVSGVVAPAAMAAGGPPNYTDAQRRAHGQDLWGASKDDTRLLAAHAGGATGSTVTGKRLTAQPGSVAPTWPVRAASTVSAARRGATAPAVRVGGLTVAANAVAGTIAGPLKVRVLDRSATTAVGVDGVLMDVQAPAGTDASSKLGLTVSYAGFADAYGGGWSSRLHLVSMPDCALSTPQVRACQVRTPVPSTNDVAAQTVTATALTAHVGVMALTAGTSGSTGSWSSTSLAASGAWQVAYQTGDFTWSYPLPVPATQGGPSPQLALSYDAGSVDGRVASTNNQSSWVGDGWDLSTGFVERKYASCADDATGDANNVGHKTGDLCWKTDNATLSLGGKVNELVKDKTDGTWHLKDDDGTKVEHLTGAWNTDNDTEYWVVTTPDGVKYYFGRNKRATSDTASLQSGWVVPVYGNNPGEPCHAAAFADSACKQAWRWNLDYVVDPSGNSATYFYTQETGYYGSNLNTVARAYARGGYLDHIDYGQRAGAEITTAPQQVKFAASGRCVAASCAAAPTTATAEDWPDVPVDLMCSSKTSCPGVQSPAFFTTKRLTQVVTEVYTAGAYKPVDTWNLTQTLPDPGDGTNRVLWLDSIQHTGNTGSTALTLPKVTFTGVQMANRVDKLGDYGPPMNRYRVSSITTEAGATISVNYTPQDCSSSDLPSSPDSNTRRCFPVYWTPDLAQAPIREYFHKYLVDTVVSNANGADSDPLVTTYRYSGGAAWHYDDNDLVPASQRTWGEFRGYQSVDVIAGASDIANRPVTRYSYFRGMDGDRQSDGTQRTATLAGITDSERFAGFLRSQTAYDGSVADDRIVTQSVNTPWQSSPSATSSDGRTARFLGVKTTQTTTPAPALPGGKRVTRTDTTYDSYGMPVEVDDQGDTSTGTDDRCTRTQYARSTTANILTTVKDVQTVSVACSVTASVPGDVVSDTRTLYDGGAYGAAPTRGLVTSVQQVASYSGSTPTYQTTATTTYDTNGRVKTTADALSRVTTTAYTPATGGPVTATTVTTPDPDGSGSATALVTTTTLDPLRGVPTTVTDPNKKVTSGTYDALGRLTAVWQPGRAQGTKTANTTYTYRTNGTGHVTSVTTRTLRQDETYAVSTTLYDGLLRARQTQTLGQNEDTGGRLIADTIYDSRGLVVQTNDAWPTTGAPSTGLVLVGAAIPSRHLLTYDGAGRPVKDTYQVNEQTRWATTTSYGGDRITTTPPAGGTPTTTISDARGRTIELDQYTGGTPSGAHHTTTYTYDGAGRMTKATDTAGNRWTYGYDLLGRQTSASDPDKGASTSTYDAAGQLTTTTDARGTTLTYTYDALGRKTLEKDAAGKKLAEWAYDTVAKGQLTSSVRYEDGDPAKAYTTAISSYSNAYAPMGQSVTIPSVPGQEKLAGTYAAHYAYLANGQLASMTFDQAATLSKETLVYYYDALSKPQWMGSGDGFGLYVADTTYSTYGEVLSQDLGNSYSYIVNNTYETGTRRLATSSLLREDHTGYDKYVTYGYDDAGDLTSAADKPTDTGTTSDYQCFSYDGLRRLTQAWTPKTADCAASGRTASNLGGAAPYWSTFGYDEVGNRTSVVNHAADGTTTTSAYSYDGSGSAGPHAVTKVATTSSATGVGEVDSTFAYDQAGNMVSRTVGGKDAQSLTWDAEGELSGVKTTSSGASQGTYVYSADGDRLLRRQGNTVTAYLPGGQELTLTGTTTLSATRYYTLGGQTVAVRTAPALAGVTTLIPDTQNTAQYAVTDTTNKLTVKRQDPFGGVRGQAGTFPGDHGFLDKPTDTTGLTQVGARYYDPGLGRFISVDPVMDLADPQQWSAYAYANNNPTTWSDPSGEIVPYIPGEMPSPRDTGTSSPGHAGSGGSSTPATSAPAATPATPASTTKPPLTCVAAPDPEPVRHGLDKWWHDHGATVVSIGTGLIVGGACELLTAGVGSVGCAVLAGAASSAAGDLTDSALNGTDLSMGKLAGDMAIGGVESAATAGLFKFGNSSFVNSAAKACSFAGSTPVLLADGTHKPIQDVTTGDKVLATDPETGEQASEPVQQVFTHTDHYYKLTLDDGTSLTTTANHPFWSATDNQFERADHLTTGESVLGADGKPHNIAASRPTTHVGTAYNLSIRNIHTYHVGADDILVHNTCGGVYTLRDEAGAVVRTGRTKNLMKRQNAHGADDVLGEYRFQVEYATDDYATQRGLEDLLYNKHPEAQVANGGLNKIRAISPLNPRIGIYRKAAADFLANQ